MRYISTRSDFSTESSAEVLINGILPDGGVLVPEYLPFYDEAGLAELAPLSFNERVVRILHDFLPDFSPTGLRECVSKAFNKEAFPSERVVSVVGLNKYLQHEYLLEMWYGPTGSYKDIAIQLYPELLNLAATSMGKNCRYCFINATCGDAGIAATAALKDFPHTEALILYPQRGLNEVQRRQLLDGRGKNILIHPVNAGFDQIQILTKKICQSEEIRQAAVEAGKLVVTVNAKSWGRLLPQVAVFVSAYADLLATGEITAHDKLNLVVPSGNLSNLLAAWYARQMGVPFRHLVCASNRNKVTSDFFSSGKFDANRKLMHTIAPSMDILRPENMERLLFELSGHNYERVNAWELALSNDGGYQVETDILRRIQAVMVGGFADDNAIMRTIREVYDRTDFAVDPHTAVGFNVYGRYEQRSKDEAKVLYVSPTSPYKTPKVMSNALGLGKGAASVPETGLISDLAKEIGVYLPKQLESLINAATPAATVAATAETATAIETNTNTAADNDNTKANVAATATVDETDVVAVDNIKANNMTAMSQSMSKPTSQPTSKLDVSEEPVSLTLQQVMPAVLEFVRHGCD